MKYLMKLEIFTESKNYIKKYENDNNIEVGDYVISYYGGNYNDEDDKLAEFINSNIGKVISIKFSSCEIMYENSFNGKSVFNLLRDFIVIHSKSKEDAEAYFATKKYNL